MYPLIYVRHILVLWIVNYYYFLKSLFVGKEVGKYVFVFLEKRLNVEKV